VASYAISKLEAEEGLQAIAERSGMEIVIVRPPLVYAAEAPGNFARLLRLVARGVPLPFGLISNRRSLIEVGSLARFIALCAEHPAAANQCFVVADDDVVSIRELVRELAAGMGRRVILLPVPDGIMRSAAILLGRERLMEQLCGNLEVNDGKARALLGWKPAQTLREGLREAGREFMDVGSRNDR
jgi:nucleoside-diphosphate-sugar epimerase